MVSPLALTPDSTSTAKANGYRKVWRDHHRLKRLNRRHDDPMDTLRPHPAEQTKPHTQTQLQTEHREKPLHQLFKNVVGRTGRDTERRLESTRRGKPQAEPMGNGLSADWTRSVHCDQPRSRSERQLPNTKRPCGSIRQHAIHRDVDRHRAQLRLALVHGFPGPGRPSGYYLSELAHLSRYLRLVKNFRFHARELRSGKLTDQSLVRFCRQVRRHNAIPPVRCCCATLQLFKRCLLAADRRERDSNLEKRTVFKHARPHSTRRRDSTGVELPLG